MNKFLCYACGKEKFKNEFYPSSIRKQDYICHLCSVKRGKRNRLIKTEQNDIHTKYMYARNSAKTNKKPFLLTEEQYSMLVTKPCYYCELPITTMGISLDRINNDKSIGYTWNNVLPCCGPCNKIRGTILTVQEAKIAICAVLEFRKGQ